MKHIKVILSWLPLAHAVFVFLAFLTIPTMRYVYFGTPMYWSDWEAGRCEALGAYIFGSLMTGALNILAKAEL